METSSLTAAQAGGAGEQPPEQSTGYNFGTFAGVFLPNILAILGVILFLRTGWVVGHAGIGYAILIVLLAHFVTVTTGLAIAALSTNMTVKSGGAYYIISRSLGIEIGGCIGIPLAISQILSIPFYIIGFVESLAPLVPSIHPMILGIVTLALMAGLSLRGADLAIKAQYVVFAIILVSLVSLFMGKPIQADLKPVIWGTFKGSNFWVVFAVFFPAVTGIMTGVSMSGDLKDPKKSIPLGTMASVFAGLVVYIAVVIFFGMCASSTALQQPATVFQISRWPQLIYAGIWAATLSSALGFLLGAPRTTQAVAADGILPKFLAVGVGPQQEPRNALFVSIGLSAVVIFMGNLNAIASVLSMFFLATYGVLNLVAGLETLVDNPSYRPTIRVPWWMSLIGAISCFSVMFLIDTFSTLIAIFILASIYIVLKKRKLDATWGDLRRGVWMSLIRRSLLQMESHPVLPKNWRPNITVLTTIPQGRLELVKFAHWFGQRNGIVTLRHLLIGPFEKLEKRQKLAKNNLDLFIRENELEAFGSVDIIQNKREDLRLMLTSQGYGSFQGNTVLFDWADKEEHGDQDFTEVIEGVLQARKNLLMLRTEADRGFGDFGSIDVWAGSREEASTTLLLAELLKRNTDWQHAKLRFFALVSPDSDLDVKREEALRLLDAGRIQADIEIVPQDDDLISTMGQKSSNSSLVICGFHPEDESTEHPLAKTQQMLDVLPTTLLVNASHGPDLLA